LLRMDIVGGRRFIHFPSTFRFAREAVVSKKNTRGRVESSMLELMDLDLGPDSLSWMYKPKLQRVASRLELGVPEYLIDYVSLCIQHRWKTWERKPKSGRRAKKSWMCSRGLQLDMALEAIDYGFIVRGSRGPEAGWLFASTCASQTLLSIIFHSRTE
jgi:hypothetical protein